MRLTSEREAGVAMFMQQFLSLTPPPLPCRPPYYHVTLIDSAYVPSFSVCGDEKKSDAHIHGRQSFDSCAFQKVARCLWSPFRQMYSPQNPPSPPHFFSRRIARVDCEIRLMLNEVCRGRRRLQRGECMSCVVLLTHHRQ